MVLTRFYFFAYANVPKRVSYSELPMIIDSFIFCTLLIEFSISLYREYRFASFHHLLTPDIILDIFNSSKHWSNNGVWVLKGSKRVSPILLGIYSSPSVCQSL